MSFLDRREIRLEPITPVFVGNGETLQNGIDFFVKNDKIVVIDQSHLMDRDVRDFNDLFKEKFARTILGVPVIVRSSLQSQQIQSQQILMLNHLIFPASSMKGLLRTCVLNTRTRKNPNVINDVYTDLFNINTLLSRGKFRKARALLKNTASPAEQLMKHRVFSSSIPYDEFKDLMISEPSGEKIGLDLNKIEIIETVGSFRRQVYAITFVRGVLKYDAKIMIRPNNGPYSRLSNITWNEIISSMKDFSVRLIEDEKKKANQGKKDKYKEFLEGLKATESCFPLKVGMFTGHIAKTVELDKNTSTFRDRVMTNIYRHLWDNRTLKLVNGVGVGWTKICIK
ncbi:RAMP superfamily CRISPR-associated protein [Sulfuracidifex metallicus]|uniref:CRISPR system Cms protein Csm5 n=1 Tax=Sulfuracidifex metallicus DSM 6482 = JCM 9184 TaxID=523847 RepID=A0A6A9QII1_SULME|nr:RAMP superfamily CRISPR-associated protein [Sulfuracidifex metallicus]MUN29087.1 CRISPR-associated protein Csm5 [Sulfuracidifex metallicus DSM 6482 = JCM 9184]WOE50401.1 RAMP superfamily CRISPR-associated protein [Sulfuracidifex metallicus DSM 6482 = JCM 9184]